MSEHPFDVCACGDYRHQHVGNGRCKLNGLHGGAGDCMKFRFSRAPNETDTAQMAMAICAAVSTPSGSGK